MSDQRSVASRPLPDRLLHPDGRTQVSLVPLSVVSASLADRRRDRRRDEFRAREGTNRKVAFSPRGRINNFPLRILIRYLPRKSRRRVFPRCFHREAGLHASRRVLSEELSLARIGIEMKEN